MFILLLLSLFCISHADNHPLFTTKPVMSGRDVVAYQQGLPEGSYGVPGQAQFAYNFSGFQFWFSSYQNRDIFVSNPWRFIPAYGGFGGQGICCEANWGPNYIGPPGGLDVAWVIIKGKLYLNQWEAVRDGFLSGDNGAVKIEAANEKWTNWFGSLYSGPFNTKCFGGHDRLDVHEDMCTNEDHMDYSDYRQKLNTSLLDENYFRPPQFDCNYKPPPHGSPYPAPSISVSGPSACVAPPTIQPKMEEQSLFVVGLLLIGGCSTVGGFLGVGFYFWRMKKINQIDHQPVVNLSEGDSLSFSDSVADSDELSL